MSNYKKCIFDFFRLLHIMYTSFMSHFVKKIRLISIDHKQQQTILLYVDAKFCC